MKLMECGKKRRPIDFGGTAQRDELLLYLLPLIGTGFFQQFYGLVNTGVVSRTLSVTAVSVIGACAASSSMQSFIATGMTTGFSMYLTRCFGEGDGRLYRQSFTAALLLVGCLLALSLLFLPGGTYLLLDVMNVPSELRAAATGYLRIVILGTGVLGIKNLLLRMLEGMGRSGASGLISSCSVVSHTLILLFCLFVLHMDVSAAALALLLNHGIIALILYFYLRKQYSGLLALELPPAGAEGRRIWKELLVNGGAKSSMMILVGIGNFVMQHAINGLSTEQIAGYAYGDSLSNFLMVPFSALATAAIASAGQNMGRRDYARIQVYHKKLMLGHWGCCGVIIVLTFLFGKPMIRLLAGNAAKEPGSVAREAAVAAGTHWLYICIPAFLGLGAAMICRNSLQVMGSYRKLLLLGLLEMSITILFALWLVPIGGYTAVCLSIAVKWMALGIAAGIWYGKRIKKLLV